MLLQRKSRNPQSRALSRNRKKISDPAECKAFCGAQRSGLPSGRSGGRAGHAIAAEKGFTTEAPSAQEGEEKNSETCLIVPIQGLSTSDSSAIHNGTGRRDVGDGCRGGGGGIRQKPAEELTTQGFKLGIEMQRPERRTIARRRQQ